MRDDRLILDRYEPIGTAGAGGFGTVQIAWDPRIQRRVAIKTIQLTELDAYRANLPGAQAVSASPTADRWHGVVPWDDYLRQQDVDQGGYRPLDQRQLEERQGLGSALQVTSLAHLPGLDEARTAAMLSDSRIVTVFDFEVRGRVAYLIMEYVEGITLTRLLREYGDYLTLDMVAAVFDAVAGALSVAHKAGVLHLDIKPDNIMINVQGQVKVTDFGLATLADASGAGTTGGGTIGYMPLEQMRREHLDARTDEWSLASVVYEMLTGDNPFRVADLDHAEAAIENAELILPSLCWDDLDDQIDDVVFYALDPDREERYASVSDFAEEVEKFLGDPRRGREQLAMVVSDALGLEPDEEDEADDAPFEDCPADRKAGLFSRLLSALGTRGKDVDDACEDGVFDDRGAPAWGGGRTSAPRERRGPLRDRIGSGASNALGRLYAAVASGFVTGLALQNLPYLPTMFGLDSAFIALVGLAAMAAIGAMVPSVGMLVSLCLLGVSIVACGHPVVGFVLMVATVVWWLASGRQSVAQSNIGLAYPLIGSVGGGSAVPLLAGTALPLPAALAATALAIVEAAVFGSFGSGVMWGWDGLAHWGFSHVDLTANLMAIVKRPSTWAAVAGWLAGTAAVSLLRSQSRRWLAVFGLVAGAALVIAGSVAFGVVVPQVIVSALVAVLVLAFV